MIRCNEEINAKLKQIYNPEGSTLRNAQNRMIEMMKWLDNVCRKNNIDYFLGYGTLIGAIRHAGFIPWDDDIDICVPYQQLDKLVKALIMDPNPNYIVQTNENDKYALCDWIRVRDINSRYVMSNKDEQKKHSKQTYQGLQIDIIPIDNRVNQNINRLLVKTHFHNVIVKKSNSNILKNIAYVLYVARKKMIRIIRKCTKKKEYWCMGYGILPFYECYRDEELFPTRDIIFEENIFRAPNNPDRFLRKHYGDYMMLPNDAFDAKGHNLSEIQLW